MIGVYTCTHIRVVQSVLEVALESGHDTLAVALDTTERWHVLVLCQYTTGLHIRPAVQQTQVNVIIKKIDLPDPATNTHNSILTQTHSSV